MENKLITEPFHLTSADPNNTETDGVANAWTDIWAYQVPRGTTLMLSKGDTFACYLEDTGPAEIGDLDSKVQIVIRDPGQTGDRQVYGPAPYIRSKEQQDQDLMARLRNEVPIVVPPRYWIVIQAYDGVVIDASDSFYDLYIRRVRQGVSNPG